jgi:hypothetical protein
MQSGKLCFRSWTSHLVSLRETLHLYLKAEDIWRDPNIIADLIPLVDQRFRFVQDVHNLIEQRLIWHPGQSLRTNLLNQLVEGSRYARPEAINLSSVTLEER